ncbi:choline dehydrogenase [Favolaschia claudopus]|uniref:Choline dehydrogenase n=1 Tax=Favolaschia claudopus TaxID=2862362 RepID=A0AAW0CSA9_9AGAR
MGRGRLHHLLSFVALSLQLSGAFALSVCPNPSKADYDYIVVGAGVGGGPVAARLAESGFSVLVVDAGHDVVNVNTTVPFFFGRAVDDPELELNYTYDEYSSPNAKFPRPDSWYPRARGIGGSTIHNAMVNNLGATQFDYDNIATMFNDPSWKSANMRKYYKKIERNLYLDSSDASANVDHGFTGWLKTSVNPVEILANPQFADAQFGDIVNTLGSIVPWVDDINSAANVNTLGVGNPVFTIDENHNRSSIRDRLVQVKAKSSGKLTFATDTLVTKILTCGASGSPSAYGIQMAPGAALPVASNFKGKQLFSGLNTKTVTARREVIISAGVFQTPQLLMLSGIGDRKQLSQFGISTVVNLPGVGTNLQDHDEVANIWTLKQNHSLFNGCTVLSDPAKDPCLEYWIESDHQNLYSFGAPTFFMMNKSSPALPEPDIMIYWTPGYFPGFFHGFADQLASYHNVLTAIVLKAHSSTRGTVKLTGSHPQDPLKIEKRHFEAAGGPADMQVIHDAIQVARDMVRHPNISQHVDAQIFPEPSEAIDDHILEHVFGHHACCTAPIGADNDPNAVLDGNFKVRGVKNLRVVDISSWPRVPGWFVTSPTYLLAEKAADVIIAAAKSN